MSVGVKKPFAKRGFLQFGLRTLLFVTAAVSVWLGLYVDRARRQQEAVRAIRAAGGWIYYDFQEQPRGSGKFDVRARSRLPKWLVDTLGEDFLFDAVEVNLVYSYDSGQRQDNKNLSGDLLPNVAALPKLKRLLLCHGQATDEGLTHVGGLRDLEALYMWEASEVTDEGLAHLTGLHKLKHIHVGNSRITDKSLAVLSQLPALEYLALQGNRFTDSGLSSFRGNTVVHSLWVGRGPTDITDDGAAFLAEAPNLEEIDLQGTKVTSKALDRFARMTKLNHLMIGGTRIDESDIRRFESALPSCKVSRQ
ncbi:MAG TPA: hypothetical protein VG125_26510 [Pirellulales bacterium]|jgi:Leucine-rich repeat (LRR) protein|nr:hypothetical protein [Pirellulales bacterium]